jgi:adenylate cyclase
VIVGEIGYRDNIVFTALGDAVNVTARLQEMTKVLECEVVLSDAVRKTAGLPDDFLPFTNVAIRGRNEPMLVRTAVKASMLAAGSEIRAGS